MFLFCVPTLGAPSSSSPRSPQHTTQHTTHTQTQHNKNKKPAEHWILPPIFIGALDSYVALQDVKAMQKDLHKVLARPVRDAMSTQVVSVPPSATMAAAASLMLDK